MDTTMMVTYALIAINVIVSLKGFSDFSFRETYKFHIGGIRRGEQIRMISSGFLHADMMHLFFNMFSLYFFAPTVISYLGVFNFVIVYFGSLILGNIFSLYFHKNEYHYSALGASGAVSGVIFSSIIFQPLSGIGLMFIPIPIPAFVFGIAYLLYSIFGMKSNHDNIGHDAHFGGALGGYVLTIMMAPWVLKQNLIFIVLLAIPILVLFVMQRKGKL